MSSLPVIDSWSCTVIKTAVWQQGSGELVWVTGGLIAKGDDCKAKPAGRAEQREEPPIFSP